jgi:hypothetical protein
MYYIRSKLRYFIPTRIVLGSNHGPETDYSDRDNPQTVHINTGTIIIIIRLFDCLFIYLFTSICDI